MKAIIFLSVGLTGCQYLGLDNNQNGLAHLKYENDACKLQVWQGGVSAGQEALQNYAISEKVTITADCELQLEYSEHEAVEASSH